MKKRLRKTSKVFEVQNNKILLEKDFKGENENTEIRSALSESEGIPF